MPADFQPCPYRLALWRARLLHELSGHLDSHDEIGREGLLEKITYFIEQRTTERYWQNFWNVGTRSEGEETYAIGNPERGWRESTRARAKRSASEDGLVLQEIRDAGRRAGWQVMGLRCELLECAHRASLQLGRLELQVSAWDGLVSGVLEDSWHRLTRGGQTEDAARLDRLHDMLCALGQPNEDWQRLPQAMIEEVNRKLGESLGSSSSLTENEFRYRRKPLDHFDPTFGCQEDNPQNENRPRISSSCIRLSQACRSKYEQLRRLQNLTIWSRATTSVTIPCFQRIAREAIGWTERLSPIHENPLYGQHKLDHVGRLLRLINDWAVAGSWVDALSPTEHAYLILAGIVHDWGMLSPEGGEEEAPEDAHERADYIRQTHTTRLPEIVGAKLVAGRQHLGGTQPLGDLLEAVAHLGASHRHWPQTEEFRTLTDKAAENLPGITKERAGGIAALAAVADLLDESVVRTDIHELFHCPGADATNKAHWLRHNMTKDTPRWLEGQWLVRLQVPGAVNEEGLEEAITPAIHAVKNQYRLAGLYSNALAGAGVDLRKNGAFQFLPESDSDIAATESDFTDWRGDSQLGSDFPAAIVGTVFREARGDLDECPDAVVEALGDLGLDDV